LKGSYSLTALVNIPESETLMTAGELYLAQREIGTAIEYLTRAAEIGQQADRCSSALWTAYMLLGEFELAWQQSDEIRHRGAHDPHRFWQGEAIKGKRIIVRFLHGYGDAVQFLRYAPILRELATSLTIEVPPRLLPLAHSFEGVDRVITWGENAPAQSPDWDVQIEGNELPYLFRTQLNDLPLSSRYLHIVSNSHQPTHLANLSCDDVRRPMRVGLVWTAGEWNPDRSIPFEALCTLLDVKGFEFWNLQQQKTPLTNPTQTRIVRQDDESCNSINGLAETISQLDLILTVDTLAAHLSGALGVPAWVLLQHAADWRWLHARCDSPWYPSVRLFRQPKPGDWKSVIHAVQVALHQQAKIHTINQAVARR